MKIRNLEIKLLKNKFMAEGTFVISKFPGLYIKIKFKSKYVEIDKWSESHKYYCADKPFPCYFYVELIEGKNLAMEDKATLSATDLRIVPDVVLKSLENKIDLKEIGREHYILMLQKYLGELGAKDNDKTK